MSEPDTKDNKSGVSASAPAASRTSHDADLAPRDVAAAAPVDAMHEVAVGPSALSVTPTEILNSQLANGTGTASIAKTESAESPSHPALEVANASKAVIAAPSQVHTNRIDPKVLERLQVPLPAPTPKAFHPLKAIVEIARAIIVAVTPYSSVPEPKVSQADFPDSFPPDLHGVVEAAVAHEDQRTARFDLKASAFLSTSGILIPLIATLMTVITERNLRGALLASVAFAALAGVASFRALQLKVGLKLSLKVAIGDDGIVRKDAKHRHTLTLMLVLKMEECVNDHRAKLIRASSILLATSTMVLCAATIVLVA